MEKKETNLKGIDFLILINTFPLLCRSGWTHLRYFFDKKIPLHVFFFVAFNFKGKK